MPSNYISVLIKLDGEDFHCFFHVKIFAIIFIHKIITLIICSWVTKSVTSVILLKLQRQHFSMNWIVLKTRQTDFMIWKIRFENYWLPQSANESKLYRKRLPATSFFHIRLSMWTSPCNLFKDVRPRWNTPKCCIVFFWNAKSSSHTSFWILSNFISKSSYHLYLIVRSENEWKEKHYDTKSIDYNAECIRNGTRLIFKVSN